MNCSFGDDVEQDNVHVLTNNVCLKYSRSGQAGCFEALDHQEDDGTAEDGGRRCGRVHLQPA